MVSPSPIKRKHTITQGLIDLGIDRVNVDSVFDGTSNRNQEFRIVKKQYFRQALIHHPDKGGDADKFRVIQTSFELLRDLHRGKTTRKNSNSKYAWLFSECFKVGGTSGGSNNKSDDDDDDVDVDIDVDEEFDMSAYDVDFSSMETPSWMFYEEAAEEELPIYRVELAKSNRSKCKARGSAKKCREGLCAECTTTSTTSTTDLVDPTAPPELIAKNELRVGSINVQFGTYSRWMHLRCWRVPYKVWLGLPDPESVDHPKHFAHALASMNEFLLSGFSDLPHSDQQALVDHCRNKKNWARKTSKKKMKPNAASAEPKTSSTSIAVLDPVVSNVKVDPVENEISASSTNLVVKRERFAMPRPGENGASGATVFSGKTFVLTGTFPEVGGGGGLSMGKDKVKAMIQSFGGRVTGSVSGKTNVLVVGKEPGMSKVSKAQARKSILLASLHDLKLGLDSGLAALEDFDVNSRKETMKIKSFSNGYNYAHGGCNSLALGASKADLDIAQGVKPHPDAVKNDPEKPNDANAKPEPSKKTSSTKRKRNSLQDIPVDSGSENKGKSKAKTKKKKVNRKTRAKTSAALMVKEEEQQDIITCDNCGNICTEQSWFLASKAEDYCGACHDTQDTDDGAVLQRNGQNV